MIQHIFGDEETAEKLQEMLDRLVSTMKKPPKMFACLGSVLDLLPGFA